MKTQHKIAILLISSTLLLFPAVFGYAQGKFNLKTGAKGQICLTCHVAFKEKLKKPYIHSPVAEGECIGCHNPHSSDHGKLLSADPTKVCYNCHDEMVPEGAKSAHQVVVEGKCTLCHDPHSADNPNNLIRAGSELCFGCHKELGEKINGNKFQHSPVKKNCLGCHNPHASAKNEKLLIAEPPTLCLKCHKTDKLIFKKIHLDYPVEKGNCASCHDPHGSNTGAILYDVVHEPVAKKMCNQCHVDPNSPNPFALKKQSFEVCQGCHYDLVTESFNKTNMHWPIADKTGCINCHTPHAAQKEGLLKGSMITVCGKCHDDTIARQERAVTKHPPISDGMCTECHSPHSSNSNFLLNQPTTIDVCATCHDWQTHSTHPIGPEVVDKRNPNLTVDCLSCHRTHGTEYKHFLHFESTKDLCVQCHIEYRR